MTAVEQQRQLACDWNASDRAVLWTMCEQGNNVYTTLCEAEKDGRYFRCTV